jgi:hypothetical protein
MPEGTQVKTLSILTAYALVVGMLYLFGFWGRFRIDILQYIQFSDILKLALYPLFWSAISAGIVGYLTPLFGNTEAVVKDEREKVFLTPSKRAMKWIDLLCGTFVVTAVFIAGKPYKLFYVAGYVGIFVAFRFEHLPFLISFIRHSILRSVVVRAGTVVLCSAFFYGRYEADKIVELPFLNTGSVVSTKIFREGENPKVASLFNGQDKLKYIGMAGDYFFFLSMDNLTTFAAKESDLYFLALSGMPSQKASPTPTAKPPPAVPAKTGT